MIHSPGKIEEFAGGAARNTLCAEQAAASEARTAKTFIIWRVWIGYRVNALYGFHNVVHIDLRVDAVGSPVAVGQCYTASFVMRNEGGRGSWADGVKHYDVAQRSGYVPWKALVNGLSIPDNELVSP